MRVAGSDGGADVLLLEKRGAVGRLTSAYLRTAFDRRDPAWQQERDALTTGANAIGRVDSK